jgi:hypothetical protein
LPFIDTSSPTARTLVETAEGLLYYRSPSAPAGRVLLISRDTLEPLMVDFGDGWDLPFHETFEMMVGDGVLRIVFDEDAFFNGDHQASSDCGLYAYSAPNDQRLLQQQ